MSQPARAAMARVQTVVDMLAIVYLAHPEDFGFESPAEVAQRCQLAPTFFAAAIERVRKELNHGRKAS